MWRRPSFYKKGAKMKVYFENSQGKIREIGEADSKEKAFEIIKDFLFEHNFTSYYTRYWEKSDYLKIDVGSHTEFFYVSKD
jgi:hypothetical protein